MVLKLLTLLGPFPNVVSAMMQIEIVWFLPLPYDDWSDLIRVQVHAAGWRLSGTSDNATQVVHVLVGIASKESVELFLLNLLCVLTRSVDGMKCMFEYL